MYQVTCLWVDARLNKASESYYLKLRSPGPWHLCDNLAQATAMVDQVSPDVIVFDFDYADITGLKSLRRIRENFPLIPLLMLAEQHYESLAIWALRSRVWDYLVKPFSPVMFRRHLDILVDHKKTRKNELMWLRQLPANRIPQQASIIGQTRYNYGTSAAISYMEAHLHEKITADDVSQQCGLTRYELSRAFKAELSVTFRYFLLKLRMLRAARMLRCTDASITDISLSVGFNDLSNFTRKFHQFYECSPGAYRRNRKLISS